MPLNSEPQVQPPLSGSFTLRAFHFFTFFKAVPRLNFYVFR